MVDGTSVYSRTSFLLYTYLHIKIYLQFIYKRSNFEPHSRYSPVKLSRKKVSQTNLTSCYGGIKKLNYRKKEKASHLNEHKLPVYIRQYLHFQTSGLQYLDLLSMGPRDRVIIKFSTFLVGMCVTLNRYPNGRVT